MLSFDFRPEVVVGVEGCSWMFGVGGFSWKLQLEVTVRSGVQKFHLEVEVGVCSVEPFGCSQLKFCSSIFFQVFPFEFRSSKLEVAF